MKSVVADYRYRVLCLRIVPVAGSSIYLTDHPQDLVIGGHTYLSTAGYQFTGYAGTAGFSPASIDVEGIAGASGLSGWRIALAQSRLREGRPLKILADELGYANASALSRAFAARVGHSPRDWLARSRV